MSLEDLYEAAVKEFGYSGDKDQFGLDLGMQVVGHGISWEDRTDFSQRRTNFVKKTLTPAERKELGSFGIETSEIKLPRDEFDY